MLVIWWDEDPKLQKREIFLVDLLHAGTFLMLRARAPPGKPQAPGIILGKLANSHGAEAMDGTEV